MNIFLGKDGQLPTFPSMFYFYAWIASIICAAETVIMYVFITHMWTDEVWAATVMFVCILAFEYWRDIAIENWYSTPKKIVYWFLKTSGCLLTLSLAVFWLWQIVDSKTIGEFGTPTMLPFTIFTIFVLAISIVSQFGQSLKKNGETTWQASMISAVILLALAIIFVMIATPQALFQYK
jgi:hypothetical protein